MSIADANPEGANRSGLGTDINDVALRVRRETLTEIQARVLEIAVKGTLAQTLEELVHMVEAVSTFSVLGSILLLDPDGAHLRHGAGPSLPREYNDAIDGIGVGYGIGSCGTAAHAQAPIYVADIATDPLWTDFQALALSHGLRACWSIPIKSGDGSVLGTFAMYHREPREPNPTDLELVDFVIQTAALVIERKRAEERLRDSEEQLRLAIEAAEVGLWDLDPQSDILFWPPRVKAMFGISPDRPISMVDFYTGLHPDDAEATSAAFAAATDPDRRALYDVEYRTIGKEDGIVRWVAAKGRGVFDTAGRCTRVLGTARDITARKESEQALLDLNASLAESERRLRAAIEASESGTFHWNIRTNALVWDEALDRLFGLLPSATARSLDAFVAMVHGEDRAAVIAACEECAATGVDFDLEFRIVRPNGEVRWLYDRGKTTLDAEGRPATMIGACVDVTDRRQTTAALAASEHRFRVAIDAVQGILWTNNAVGEMEGEQPGWAALTGQSATEYQGFGWSSALHPDDVQPTLSAWREAVARKDIFVFEHRLRRHDGQWRCFSVRSIPRLDEAGAIVDWVGVHTDVTEQREAEDALRVMNETLESRVSEVAADLDRVWRNASDIFVVIDGDGLFRRINPATTAILGWSEAELIGRSLFDFVYSEDVALTLAALEQARGEVLPTVENRYRTKNGGLRTISWVATPEGDLIYAYGRDVTAERTQQAELRVAQDALRQSQKLEAIGQLTGGVAHDFNNLLTVIRSAADLLRRRDLSDDKRRRYVDAISDTADRAAKLTGQLLAFARRQSLKPEILDIGRSIGAIGEMIGTLTGSRIRFSSIVPETPYFISADSSQFDTAIVNMAVNARDAMHGEGSLTITVAPASSIPALRSHPEVAGEFVAVSIADTGAGIPPDKLDQIFEPFFTTKGVGEGTGLGLSQVFGFAKQSGGDVQVKSEIGLGTTFTLYLPRVEGEEQPSVDEAKSQPLPPGHATCVLVVEDNADVGEFATQSLKDLGYHSVYAPDAEHALAELDHDAERFDIVFTDIVMPGMSGIELAQEIRRRHPKLPVVLTSGYSHVLAQNGTFGFELLHKPYSVEQLSRTLRKVLEWRRRQQSSG